MSIKHHFVRLAEKITGRKCSRCVFNHGGKCNLNQDAFSRCWQSLDRPDFVTKNEGREPAAAVAMDTSGLAPGDLTPEEKHQLGKIVESLQEASTTAQDAGLLDAVAAKDAEQLASLPVCHIFEDKTESGLLEDE